jgi:hypothetical protein
MPPKTELMVSQPKGLNIEKRHLDGALAGAMGLSGLLLLLTQPTEIA